MKCLTWNLSWASPTSDRLKIIQEEIRKVDPDVVCYTEIIRTVLHGGHSIEASSDYGYANTGDRRKAVLWSKEPWVDPDMSGDPMMPSGRFISGVAGGIRFVGVCIPWKDAHVRSGRRDRAPWEDHVLYCEALGRILDRYSKAPEPICILGDFNQRIPRLTQPDRVAKALTTALTCGFTVPTEGMIDQEGIGLIDHFAVSNDLIVSAINILHRFAPDGTRLSDHVGVAATIETKKENNKGCCELVSDNEPIRPRP